MSPGILKELISSTSYLVTFIAWVITAFYLISLIGRIRKFIYRQSYSGKEKLLMIVIFGFLGVLASEYGLKLIGAVVNVRDCIAIFAGILGGPAVGIGAGLISGFYRMTGIWWKGWTGTLGYWSAIGCGLATIGAGFVGAWLSKYKKFSMRRITTRKIFRIGMIAVIWEIIHIHIFVPLTSPLYTDKTFWWIQKIFFKKYLFPMGLVNSLGILLFLFIVRDLVVKREVELAEREIMKAKLRKREKR